MKGLGENILCAIIPMFELQVFCSQSELKLFLHLVVKPTGVKLIFFFLLQLLYLLFFCCKILNSELTEPLKVVITGFIQHSRMDVKLAL